jgi:hypothetical protein
VLGIEAGVAHPFPFRSFRLTPTIWVPLDKNEGVVKAHVVGRVPKAR